MTRQSARAGSLAAASTNSASAICRCIATPLAREAFLALGKSKVQLSKRQPSLGRRLYGVVELSLLVGIKSWCPGAESNHRHCDFQSHALPTELPGRRGPPKGRAKQSARFIEAGFPPVQT